jgi:hypothetical protein
VSTVPPTQQNVPAPVSALQVPNVASGVAAPEQDTPAAPAVALQSRLESEAHVSTLPATQQNVPAPVSALQFP